MTPAASISVRVSNDINGCILPITLVVRVERSSRGACVCVCFYDNTITFKRKIIFALTNSERWVTLTQSDYVKFIGQGHRSMFTPECSFRSKAVLLLEASSE